MQYISFEPKIDINIITKYSQINICITTMNYGEVICLFILQCNKICS